MKLSFYISENVIWPLKCIVFGYSRLPESDEDDGKKTSPFESRGSSSDFSEPCVIEEDTVIGKEDELEQLFHGDEIDPENDEFCKFIFMVYDISFYRHFKIL